MVEVINLVDTELKIILKEFVKTSFGRDIRVIAIGGRMAASMQSRQWMEVSANITRGGGGKPIEVNNDMEFLSQEEQPG